MRTPNALTAHTLNAGKAGKNVKRFGSKKALFAALIALGYQREAKKVLAGSVVEREFGLRCWFSQRSLRIKLNRYERATERSSVLEHMIRYDDISVVDSPAQRCGAATPKAAAPAVKLDATKVGFPSRAAAALSTTLRRVSRRISRPAGARRKETGPCG